jgi:hypothetical protein
MPNIHVIIGDANTRKSSLLRCLTGFGGNPNKRDMEVSLANNGRAPLSIPDGDDVSLEFTPAEKGEYVVVHCKQLAGLQEMNCQTPENFIIYINSLNPIPTDVAVILRVHGTKRESVITPEAMKYIQAFNKEVNWNVKNVALLGDVACALQGFPSTATAVRVPFSQDLPTNLFAFGVRAKWGWR